MRRPLSVSLRSSVGGSCDDLGRGSSGQASARRSGVRRALSSLALAGLLAVPASLSLSANAEPSDLDDDSISTPSEAPSVTASTEPTTLPTVPTMIPTTAEEVKEVQEDVRRQIASIQHDEIAEAAEVATTAGDASALDAAATSTGPQDVNLASSDLPVPLRLVSPSRAVYADQAFVKVAWVGDNIGGGYVMYCSQPGDDGCHVVGSVPTDAGRSVDIEWTAHLDALVEYGYPLTRDSELMVLIYDSDFDVVDQVHVPIVDPDVPMTVTAGLTKFEGYTVAALGVLASLGAVTAMGAWRR